MERIHTSFGTGENQKLLEEYEGKLIYKDKEGNDLKVGDWVIYSERMDGKYNYADSLARLMKDDKYLIRQDTKVYNKNGFYEELEDINKIEPEIYCHTLEIYKKDDMLYVYVMDLKKTQVLSDDIDDLIELMDKEMPLNGVMN